jgi:hypothetical protein
VMPGKITRLLFEKADRRRAGRRATGSYSMPNGHLESDRNGHGLFLASRHGQNPLARVTRSERESCDEDWFTLRGRQENGASLQTTDYHSRDEQVLFASWGREDLTTDSLRFSRPFDEVRLQPSPCPSASDNDIACEPDCRWTGNGYRGRSCRTDVLEELEHI